MVNKKIGTYIVILFFLISFFIGYSASAKDNVTNRITSPIIEIKGIFGSADNDRQLEKKQINEPQTEPCPLNGALYSKSQRKRWEKRRPLGIMVENHIEARPQSGLSSADVVYETVAEGGITRFLAVYYCQDADYVGPVRSARIYFIKLLQEYGDYPLYAHVGGANTPGPADALGEIRDLGWINYNDLNQFSVPFPNFWRDYERLSNRATEHTVYTSTEKLWQYAASKRGLTDVDKKGNLWQKNFESWQFKDDSSEKDRGDLKTINFNFWEIGAGNYSVSWQYNKLTNSFRRYNGGLPHLDKNTGQQLEAKNVIIIFAKELPANDGYEGGHLLYKIIGQGSGLLFQNGKTIEISWEKPAEEKRMKFYDKKGEEIFFVRGLIWIEILPLGNKVEY